MKELFEALLAALRRGETAALCTILGASGSAPRGAGAKMAVFVQLIICCLAIQSAMAMMSLSSLVFRHLKKANTSSAVGYISQMAQYSLSSRVRLSLAIKIRRLHLS